MRKGKLPFLTENVYKCKITNKVISTMCITAEY